MGRLSPRANSGEDVEAGELVATDLDEVIPQRLLDAAKVVLRQAEGLDDAGRFGAAVPGDDDGAARTNDPMQLAHRGFKVGPDRDVSDRDRTVDAGVGKTRVVGRAEVEPNPAGPDGLPIVPPGLVSHLRRRVNPTDARRLCAFGEQSYETARPITDLENVVPGLHAQNADHIVLLVGPAHDPPRQPAEPAARMSEGIVR